MRNKENVNGQGIVTEVPVSRTQAVVIPAILIAIGAVLRMFSPNILGITPNFVIAMYCLAIILLKPSFRGAAGIGIVAGAVSMIFSKSPVPALNLITEPAGAVACLLVVRYLPELILKNYSFKPVFATLFGTLASGGLYVLLNFILVLQLPYAAMQAAFIGVVVPVAVINAVLAQVLYAPSRRFINF